jgi:hypothetical protein
MAMISRITQEGHGVRVRWQEAGGGWRGRTTTTMQDARMLYSLVVTIRAYMYTSIYRLI